MITLPSDYTAAIVRGESSDRVGWVARFYFNDESTSFNFGLHDAHETGTGGNLFTPDGIIHDISPIVSSIDPFNGSYSVANCTLRIADTDRHGTPTNADATLEELLLFATRGYLNRTVIIYKYYLTASTGAYTDCAAFFKGIIYDYSYDVESGIYTIELIHHPEKYHKELPSTIISKANYPKAPDSSLNKPLPILYGSWFTSNANPYYDYYHGVYNMAPCVCTDAHAGNFIVAHHAINSWSTSAVCVFDDGLGAYGIGLIRDDASTRPSITLSGPSYATIGSTSSTSFWMVDGIYLFPTLKGTQSGITSESVEYITDKKYDTVADNLAVDYYVTFQGGLSSSLFWPIAPTSNDITIFANVSDYTGAGSSYLRIYNPDGGASYPAGGTFNTNGLKTQAIGLADNRTDGSGTSIATTSSWSMEELGRYEFGINLPGGGVTLDLSTFGIVLSNISCSEFSLINRQNTIRKGPPSRYAPAPNDYGISDPLRNIERDPSRRMIPFTESNIVSDIVYALNTDGRAISSAIGDRAGNTLTTGNVMVMSHFIAEDIVRQELGDSNIDTDSFDDADEASSYMFCFSLADRIYSRDLLRDLGHNSMAIYFYSADGQFRCRQLVGTPPTSDADLDFHDINFLGYRWSSPDWLVNDMTVNYHYDYAKQEFQMQETASDSTSQGNSASGYNRTKKYSIDSPYLRYQPFLSGALKADSLATNFLAFWKDAHLIIDFEVINPLYEGLQEGDTVKFLNVPGLGNSYGVLSCNPFGLGGGSADDCMSTFTSPRTESFLIISCQRTLTKTQYTCMQWHSY